MTLPPDQALLTEVSIIDQLMRTRIARRLPQGLSQAQFGVLHHFARRGGTESPAQLAAAFEVTRGAMTNTLQRLEAQGFVAVRGDAADGRRKVVSLTPAGRTVHGEALARLSADFAGLRAAFGEAEFAAALPFLSRLRAWLDQNRPPTVAPAP